MLDHRSGGVKSNASKIDRLFLYVALMATAMMTKEMSRMTFIVSRE